MIQSKLLKKLAISLVCVTGTMSSAAFAAPCTVVAPGNAVVGNASTDDVTLNSLDSTSCAFSGANPVAGPNGTTSGFDSVFASYAASPSSTWSLLGKIENNTSIIAGNLTLTLTQDGQWTVKNTSASAVTLDLVLAIHAGNGSGAFLFDNQAIGGMQTLTGTWKIDWFNRNNQNHPGFSNAAFFARDLGTPGTGGGDGTPVPEPGSLALLGAGMLGVMSLRKRNKA